MSGRLFHDQPVPDADLLLLRFAGGALGQVGKRRLPGLTMVNDTEIACEGGCCGSTSSGA